MSLGPVGTMGAAELAGSVLGEPNGKLSDLRRGDLRFGRRGSLSVKVPPHPMAGSWYDFEAGVGGGAGSLASHLGLGDGVPVRSRTAVRERRAVEGRSDYGAGAAEMWSRASVLQAGVPGALALWLRARSLWRGDIPLPGPLRWLPGPNGGGTLLALAAPSGEWRERWPLLPGCRSLQRIPVGGDGAGGGIKKSLGRMYGAVMVLGDPRGGVGGALVCEGVADGLALAARYRETVVVVFGTAAMEGAAGNGVGAFLAGFEGGVTVWADADQPSGGVDARPRRGPAGGRAAYGLQRAVVDAGGRCQLCQPAGVAKDVAELAAAAGFRDFDRRSVVAGVQELRGQALGAPEWELWRRASLEVEGMGSVDAG